MANSPTFGLRFDVDLTERIKERATAEGRTRSGLVQHAVRLYVSGAAAKPTAWDRGLAPNVREVVALFAALGEQDRETVLSLMRRLGLRPPEDKPRPGDSIDRSQDQAK